MQTYRQILTLRKEDRFFCACVVEEDGVTGAVQLADLVAVTGLTNFPQVVWEGTVRNDVKDWKSELWSVAEAS